MTTRYATIRSHDGWGIETEAGIIKAILQVDDGQVTRVVGEGQYADSFREALSNGPLPEPDMLALVNEYVNEIVFSDTPPPVDGPVAKAHWRMVNITDGSVAGIVQTDSDPLDPALLGYVGENPPIGFREGMPLREYVQEAREFNFEPMDAPAEAAHDHLPDLIRATGDAIARVIEAHGEISKVDEDKRLAFGWVYVTHDKDGKVAVDKSGEFVDDYEEIEKAAYNFVINSRSGDADHTNVKTSEMVESMVFTPEKIAKMGIPPGILPTGWWCGFRVDDDKVWKSVKEGKRLAFSVHGKGVRKRVD